MLKIPPLFIIKLLLENTEGKIMKATIGIDIGGSTTKIAGFTEEKKLLGTPLVSRFRFDL